MSTDGAGVDAFVEDFVKSVTEDAELLAEEGGITADTQGRLTPEMLLRLLRWRCAQGLTLYSQWAGDATTEIAFDFAWKANSFAEQCQTVTGLLERKGAELESLDFSIRSDTLSHLASCSSPTDQIVLGLIVAPSFRQARDRQANIIAEANADLRAMNLYRETVLPAEEQTIDRGRELLAAQLQDSSTDRAAVQETADEFFEIARRVQEESMDEAGDVDPTAIC